MPQLYNSVLIYYLGLLLLLIYLLVTLTMEVEQTEDEHGDFDY